MVKDLKTFKAELLAKKGVREAYDMIMDGLIDALAYAEGDHTRGKTHTDCGQKT